MKLDALDRVERRKSQQGDVIMAFAFHLAARDRITAKDGRASLLHDWTHVGAIESPLAAVAAGAELQLDLAIVDVSQHDGRKRLSVCERNRTGQGADNSDLRRALRRRQIDPEVVRILRIAAPTQLHVEIASGPTAAT